MNQPPSKFRSVGKAGRLFEKLAVVVGVMLTAKRVLAADTLET